jgi:hypothetical protein
MARLAAVDKRIADIDKRLADEFPTYERTHRVTEVNDATLGKWNAKRSGETQTLPQAARRKIEEDTHLRGEGATSGVKQMNGKGLNLKVSQDDPQRPVINRVGTLVVQYASHTHSLGCSPNGRLGRGH